MEGRCKYKYIEKAIAASRQGVVVQLGVGRGASNSSPQKNTMLRTIHNCLELGMVLWYNLWLRNGQVAGFLICANEPKMRGISWLAENLLRRILLHGVSYDCRI
jgi:hypothetical protein